MNGDPGPASASGNPFIQVRHDLRNAVDQILGYADILREDCRDRGVEGLDDDLQRIEHAARRILSLVDGLLADAAPGPVEAAAEEAPRPAAEERRGDDGGAATGSESARLLVVDDDDAGRELLERRLERRGYATAADSSGEAALRRLQDGSFDLVLLDLEMPGLGGMGTLDELRRRFSPSDLPVIVVTGRTGSSDVVEALERGANDYVTKPFDPAVLEARIGSQLTLRRLIQESAHLARQLELRSRFLRQVFGRYLSDEVVQSLLASPQGLKLGGERRTVTILMADLRGFSAHAERLEPEQVMDLLNDYLSAMTDVIVDAGGTIDEFLGDAILVFFGAPLPRPDHARAAVRCALQMQRTMDEVRDRLAERGLPRVEMGVGVHTGEAVVGNIGSEKRAKFGAVGRAINLAARIESLTSGGEVLISADTRDAAGDGLSVEPGFEFHPKGEPKPVAVHEVRGLAGEDGVELQELAADLQTLPRPERVTLVPFGGKRLGDDSLAAEVVRLSRRAAEVRVEGELPVRTDVQLELASGGAAGPGGVLYAKVVAVPAAAGRSCRLRFTWVPGETADRIDALLASRG